MSPCVPPPDDVSVDPAARGIGMLGFGCDGMRVVRRWLAQVPEGVPVAWAAAERADARSLAELERQVAAAVVGWRWMVAGPEADVLAARALLTRLGLLEAELRFAVTEAVRRRVYCPHCTATTEAEVSVGEVVQCSGCTLPLRVQDHVSRRLAASLGVVEDAGSGSAGTGSVVA